MRGFYFSHFLRREKGSVMWLGNTGRVGLTAVAAVLLLGQTNQKLGQVPLSRWQRECERTPLAVFTLEADLSSQHRRQFLA